VYNEQATCYAQPKRCCAALARRLLELPRSAAGRSAAARRLARLAQYWLRLDAHDPAVAELELNFRTPYLLGYPVARALAAFLPILTALKLTFWASIRCKG